MLYEGGESMKSGEGGEDVYKGKTEPMLVSVMGRLGHEQFLFSFSFIF